MSKKGVKKALRIVGNCFLYLFLLLCIFSVVLTVASKKDSDGAANIFGHQIRVVTSDSMAKCDHTDVSQYKIKSIPVRSLLLIDLVPDNEAKAEKWYSSLKVGDVLTIRYVYTSQVTITHRIVSINEKADGGYMIELKGDNTSSMSGALSQTIDTSDTDSPNYVVGKVTGQSYPLGVFLSLLKSPVGIILVIILPCFIIILLEILRIVGLYSAEKRKKHEEEREERENELEELRRKLAELEGSNAAGSVIDTPAEASELPRTGDSSESSTKTEPEATITNIDPVTESTKDQDQPNIEPTPYGGDSIDT